MASTLAAQATSADERIRAAKAGDAKAIEALVIHYWPFSYRIAYLLLGDAETAEEVAQDSLLRAIRALDSFELGRPFEPWLGRISANCAHDARRRASRYPDQFDDDELGLSAGDDDLADEIARNSLSADLEQALAAINPDARAAVVMRHLLDYSPEEIAEIIGVSAGTVRSRIHRGLVALRLALSESKELTND